jgi:hypothetical protein
MSECQWSFLVSLRAAPRCTPNKGVLPVSVSPYHSINQTDPDVHHIYDNCPNGQRIPAANRRNGKNGWPLCGSCARM